MEEKTEHAVSVDRTRNPPCVVYRKGTPAERKYIVEWVDAPSASLTPQVFEQVGQGVGSTCELADGSRFYNPPDTSVVKTDDLQLHLGDGARKDLFLQQALEGVDDPMFMPSDGTEAHR